MDAEAIQIFWDYLDYDWDAWDVNDNDGMFADVFEKTADRIMTVTTTTKDLIGKGLFILSIVVIGGVVIILVTKKYKRDKEKAQETIDILNTPLEDIDTTDSDDLLKKYEGK
jgi:hypothetical protein